MVVGLLVLALHRFHFCHRALLAPPAPRVSGHLLEVGVGEAGTAVVYALLHGSRHGRQRPRTAAAAVVALKRIRERGTGGSLRVNIQSKTEMPFGPRSFNNHDWK